MARLVIKGGRELRGVLSSRGAKNAALPIMAASLLAEGDVLLERIPCISDVWVMAELLRTLGATVEFDGASRMLINTDRVDRCEAPYELVRKMNASFDITGALLARFHNAKVPLPGGCNLGSRPVDLHLDGFRALGAEVSQEHGYVQARTNDLKGAKIYFNKPSVGATKNVMMAACLAEGKTILENAAKEPEIVDLSNFLNSMGARIMGAGTPTIEVEGASRLKGTKYSIIADRIEAGTYLLAGVITRGEVTIREIDPFILEALLVNLRLASQEVETGTDWIRVRGARPIHHLEVTTAPFPGFPTDLQPPIVAFLSLADGTSIVKETIFDRRFMYVDEMRRLGADIRVTDHIAVVCGVGKLTGAPVDAPDIRAGGALVLAGLAAEGETIVGGVEYLDRGYERIEENLQALGAHIRRLK